MVADYRGSLTSLIWRPVIAWADKFKFEQVETAQNGSQLAHSDFAAAIEHPMTALLDARSHPDASLSERIYRRLARADKTRPGARRRMPRAGRASKELRRQRHHRRPCVMLALVVGFAAFKASHAAAGHVSMR